MIRRILYCSVILSTWAWLFLFSWDQPWQHKFERFGVPAYPWPGIDARNIQMAAYCSRKGLEFRGNSECLEAGEPVKALYPDLSIQPYNYPSWWARLYRLLGSDSEHFFRAFWTLNASLLALTLAAYCYRYSYLLLPLILFSPVVLLTMERGNIDAATCAILFMPLLLRSDLVAGLALGAATACKIFPAVAYSAFLPKPSKPFIIGALLALPAAAASIMEAPAISRSTTYGFAFAYGIASLRNISALMTRPALAWALIAVGAAALLGGTIALAKKEPMISALDAELTSIDPHDRVVAAVSLAIFVATFALTTSWCYRLVFLVPAILVIPGRSPITRAFWVLLLAMLWSPWLPHGVARGALLNLACWPLAVLASCILFRYFSLKFHPAADVSPSHAA